MNQHDQKKPPEATIAPRWPAGLVKDDPCEVAGLREMQRQCAQAANLNPTQAQWHMLGVGDFFVEELLIEYPDRMR